eukprot:Gb_00734 [translate_table: standard]
MLLLMLLLQLLLCTTPSSTHSLSLLALSLEMIWKQKVWHLSHTRTNARKELLLITKSCRLWGNQAMGGLTIVQLLGCKPWGTRMICRYACGHCRSNTHWSSHLSKLSLQPRPSLFFSLSQGNIEGLPSNHLAIHLRYSTHGFFWRRKCHKS